MPMLLGRKLLASFTRTAKHAKRVFERYERSVKVRDVTTVTPRRLSKRSKRSTIKLDTTFKQMEEIQVSETVTTIIEATVGSHIETEEPKNCHNSVETINIDNKVMTASDLMSELSVKEDENEWMTDEEECQQKKDLTSSERTNSSRMAGSSSNRSVRSYSRIQKKTDNKALIDSAMKRRQEAEDQRRIKLMASEEKKKRAVEKRRILLEEKVAEKKKKSQEKVNRVAELRERQKQMETERLEKELEKREELDRKRNEDRREQLRKKQEDTAKKAQEVERRKQMKELQEMALKMTKQEELERKREQDKELLRERERMAACIQQHNSSLQQKAVANSFVKSSETNTQLVPKVVVTKLSPSETDQRLNNTYKVSEQNTPEEVPQTKGELNITFVMKKDSKEHSSYDMTPPPKEHDYDNYDISGIQSDDDTDDEQQPRKRIPNWARGHNFFQQIHSQYNKSQRAVNKEAEKVFGSGDQVLGMLEDDFSLMFPQKPLHPKYAKRTSSAVWEECPSRYQSDESFLNQSSNQ